MIEIKGLQKVSGGQLVLDIEALTVAAGEIAAIVGPADSGRAPLFDLLVGRARPTIGAVSVGGLDPFAERGGFSRQVGVLFAEDAIYSRQTVRQNLSFRAQLYGLPVTRVGEVLAEVGLADCAETPADKLPSGLARRLAFGCATLHRPQTLLAVEPFARCDEASISLLSGLMGDLAEGGGAVLILADDAARLNALCSVIYTLAQGRIAESYAPAEQEAGRMPFKIPVKLEAKVALINPADILYANSEESRTYLQTTEGRLPTQFTLTELESRLSRSGFFRAHRAYLVNLQHIREVIPYTRNSFSLCLDDAAATEIPLSKAAAGELRELLGY